jgi:hypothetical protein
VSGPELLARIDAAPEDDAADLIERYQGVCDRFELIEWTDDALPVLESLLTRNRALEGVIAEHNKRCERECADWTHQCPGPWCPRRYMIEVK